MSSQQVQKMVVYALQTVGGLLLLICVGLSSWALVEVVELKVAHARLITQYESDRLNRDDQIGQIRQSQTRIEFKLDQALQARQ